MTDRPTLAKGGILGEMIRAYDWTSTALGPIEAWPQQLLTLVEVMLGSNQPMYVVWGPKHTLIYNDAWIPLIAQGHPAALGGSFLGDVLPELREDITPFVRQAFRGEPVHMSNIPMQYNRRGYLEEAVFSFSFTPVTGPSTEIEGFFASVMETSGQVFAERKLRELNENLEQQVEARTAERNRVWEMSLDLMVIADMKGTIEVVNPAWTQVLGWSEAELLNRSIFKLIDPEDVPRTLNSMQQTSGSQSFAPLENRYRHRDGSYRDIAWTYGPDQGKLLGVGRDVTQERARDRALAQAEAALRQSQKMEAVGQLTGGLAHDFNNLLAGISGSLELMQVRMRQGRLSDLDRYLSAAQGASKRAAALTHRLLAFSRRQTLSPRPTDVNRLAQGMEELIQRTVGPMITVEVVGSSGAWPALVDPPQLENALLNLCINARDAMPEGGRITIETANKWLDARAAQQHAIPEGQYLSLCVSDTGTGMTPEVIARALEPFFTTKPIGEGTGLGLSMIYGFAQQSGGQVRIYSEMGQGSTVCIYLPRHYGEVDSDPGAQAAATLERAEHDKTVLVVDDEPTVRMLVLDILQDLGYATLEAGDSATGLKILQSGARIDLLVSDVGLPGGMNGRQMADAARTVRPGLKVLFITGYAENAILGNGVLAPGMAVVTKPFSLEAMEARIRLMMDEGAAG
jgi:PAS domain S-box-containing protein